MKIKDKIIYVTVATAMGINMIPMNVYALEEKNNTIPVVDTTKDNVFDEDVNDSNIKSDDKGKDLNKDKKDPLNKNNNVDQDESLKDDQKSNSNNELNESVILENTVQTFSATNENAEGNIEISETNFPDATFREIVKNFSSDGNVLTLEERSQITELGLQQQNITSLKGIEYFPNLENLYCSTNKLTQLDVSQNKKLKKLMCYDNQLQSLDVSQNSELVGLQCDNNQLTSLSLNNPRLKELWCNRNQIMYLDLSTCPELTYLNGDDNKLTSLDLSKNPLLTNVRSFNSLREVPTGMSISELQGFDVSKVTNIQGGNFNDGKVNFTDQKITYTYDCGNNIAIEFTLLNSDLIGETVEINAVNFPDPNFRKYVRTLPGAEDGQFTGLELGKIKEINASKMNIKSLKGIEFFTFTKSVACKDNQLTTLDLSKNTNLNLVNCSNNKLSSIDLTNNPKLNRFWCTNNQLVSIDFNQNSYLNVFMSKDNKYILPNGTPISEIPGFNLDKVSNIQGGNFDNGKVNFTSNEITYTYDCGNESTVQLTLQCEDVEINEENFPDSFFRGVVKELPGAEDGKFTKQELDEIKVIQVQVNFGTSGYSLKGIEYFENLEILKIFNTQLESVDLSKNKKLRRLFLYRNKLKSLDVSNNPELEYLNCSENQLTSLDISKNTKLEDFYAGQNKRTVPDGISLSYLPGFDKSKATNIQGGNFDNDKVNFTSNTITYTYDCGNGKSETFTLEKGEEADYTVKHLQQQLDGTYKEVTDDTQTLKGVVGKYTEAKPNTYEGFTVNGVPRLLLSENGRIVEIKYDRNKHNVTWDLDEGTASNKYTSGEVMFGTPIVAPEPTKKGYDFVGWNTTIDKTMPDTDVTYAAVWEKAHNHVLTLKKGKAATCTEAGYKDYYECECGKFFEDAKGKKVIKNLEAWKKGDGKLEKLGHNLRPITGNTPTCQHEGLKSYLECKTCGKAFDPKTKEEITNLTEWRKIPKLEHDLTKIDRVEPTKDKDGVKEYYQCKMCKKYYSDAQGKNEILDLESWKKSAGKLDKLSHTLKAVEGLEPTCEEDGFKPYYQCEKCNKYFEDDKGTKEITNLEEWKKGNGKLEKLGHLLHPINGVSATCQNEGLKSYLECETCGKAFDPNTKEEITNLTEWRKIPKLEHDLTKIDRVEPTKDKGGVKEYYQCKMCKKYYSDLQGKNEILDLEAWKKGAGKLDKLPEYQIIEGMNGKWNKGSKDGLTFKSNGEFEELIGVTVDGVMIDKKDYTAKDGSTIVTLKPEYLETLKTGKHTIDMVYQNGMCGTQFEIINDVKPTPEIKPTKPEVKPQNPKPVQPTKPNSKTPTSVMTNSQTWLNLAGLSAVLGSILTFKKRNKK